MELLPLGDRAYLANFPNEANARAWAAAARSAGRPDVLEVTVAYRSAAVFADPGADLDRLRNWLCSLTFESGDSENGRIIEVPTLYDGEDLDAVANALGLSVAQVIESHTSETYEVFALGFQPGFPYAGYLPPQLSGLHRRAEPRKQVPPGSVAIVGEQTAIYPGASPGGWHLIGRTPCRVVDVAESYFPIGPGDRLKFGAISAAEFEAKRGEHL